MSISVAHYRNINFVQALKKPYDCTRARFRFFPQGCLIGPSPNNPLFVSGARVRIFSPYPSEGRGSRWRRVLSNKPEASWGFELDQTLHMRVHVYSSRERERELSSHAQGCLFPLLHGMRTPFCCLSPRESHCQFAHMSIPSSALSFIPFQGKHPI